MATKTATSPEPISSHDTDTTSRTANDAAIHDSDDSNDAEKQEAQGTPIPARTVTGLRWFLVCTAIYVSAFVYGLDMTIVADIQGAVVEQFGNVHQLAWVGSGFPLGSVATILFFNVMYANFDVKWLFIASVVIFEVGSAVCGAAPSMAALIVGRVIAGAGGSGMYLGCLNYLSALTVPRERGAYVGAMGLFWGAGAVLGPVIGGAFVESSATWRYAFYINLFIAAVLAPIYFWGLPSRRPTQGISVMERVKKFDLLGLLLNVAMWVSFTMAFTMGGAQWPWGDGRFIAMIVVWVVVTAAFAVQQALSLLVAQENRCFPVSHFTNRTQILVAIGTMTAACSSFITLYYIPIYFQFVQGDTATQAAVRLLPYIIVSVAVTLAVGALLPRVKYYFLIYVAAGMFLVAGNVPLVVLLKPSTPVSVIYGITAVTAIGVGLTQNLGYTVASLTANHDIGGALALQNIGQLGGSVISLVVAGQTFQAVAFRNLYPVLSAAGFSAAEIRNAAAGAKSATFQQLTGHVREEAISAITNAMQFSFIIACIGSGILVVAGLLMKRQKLSV